MRQLSDQAFYHFYHLVKSLVGLDGAGIDKLIQEHYLKGCSPDQSATIITALLN